jgi:hypothetical protein
MFQAFDLDEVLVVEEHAWILTLNDPVLPTQLPWDEPVPWGLDPEYRYSFDLFLGLFGKSVIQTTVRDLYSVDDFTDYFNELQNTSGTTCLLRLGVSEIGEPLVEDARISTLPWAIHTIKQQRELSLDAFDEFGRNLLFNLIGLRSTPPGDPSESAAESEERPRIRTWDHLHQIAAAVQADLEIPWGALAERIVLVAHRLGKKRLPTPAVTEASADPTAPTTPTSTSTAGTPATRPQAAGPVRIRRRCDILNSFFLRDLQRVAQQVHRAPPSSPLVRYLRATPHPKRIDLSKPSARLWRTVAPKSTPLGRWPHAATQCNALMQQLAVNEFNRGKQPLFAVNGPPGTGKTTLIKDVVAALIVQRALRLVQLRSPDEAFEKERLDFEVDRSRFSICRLRKEFTGFEIVVASSNNNAVENITRELPRRNALGPEFQGARYLTEVARMYETIRHVTASGATDTPPPPPDELWGLISCPLGNRANRELFCDALLYGPREEKDQKLKRQNERLRLTLHEWRKQVPEEGTVTYAKARLLLLEAHKRVEEHLEGLSSQADLAHTTPHDGALNSPDFDTLTVQGRAPWVSPEGNALHSELLLAALTLQQAWVREARALGPILSALGKFLARPEGFDREAALVVWQTLFMVVPVVSSTLASIERMCAPLGEGSIGTVLIEEAGQATPQSVAGALWRARRALVIGDPMQIQPVVAAPEVLIRHFAKKHKVTSPLLSPLASSAQALADESNQLGASLHTGTLSTWVGCPLRVHRRCLEPMFSIANTVAYGGLMTYGTAPLEPHEHLKQLPPSGWFDVIGGCAGRHWVPAQGETVATLMAQILQVLPDVDPDVFFISPFRSVREELARLLSNIARRAGYTPSQLRRLRQRIGTVHTFQGKEASLVVFVLGCDESTRGAARWAGERPNLVNVAVTRARHRLYVVGSLALWHNQGSFAELASTLPRLRCA